MSLPTPSDFSHVLPEGASTQFSSHRDALADFFAKNHSADRDVTLSPYPVYVPPERISELYALFAALHPALVAIVKSWWARPELQSAIPVSSKMERVLRNLEATRPYESVGSMRPDYLIPESSDDSLRICEINARFIFNGFYHAARHDNAVQALGFNESWKPTTLLGNEVDAVIDALIDPTQPTALITGDEHVKSPFAHKIGLGAYNEGHSASFIVHPKSLRLTVDGQLTDGTLVFKQAVIQLHQYELEALDEDVLLALARICYNDLRTVFFVHDKRILGLLRRELPWLVSEGFINEHQASCLAKGIAETYLPSDSTFRELALSTNLGSQEKNQWTLKKFMSGKGEGMVFGKNVDAESWSKLLLAQMEASAPTHLLQRYAVAKKVSLLVPDENGKPQHVSWGIVGTMLIFGRTLIGLTCFRANNSDVVALSCNGTAMAGVTTAGIPPSFTLPARRPRYLSPQKSAVIAAPPHAPTPEHAAAVQASLSTHGLAIITLPNPDPNSDYLVALTALLGCPIAHSAKHGALWDVTPSPAASSGARSHSSADFPWHTDCSFEKSPPRYFGLHIVRHDRFGGGNLRLLPTDEVLAAVPTTVVDTLRKPVFRFDVPQEFNKGEASATGAVLSGDKIRWRREIMHGETTEAQTALDAMEAALVEVDDNALVLGPDLMRPGVVLCIDNGRFLHARSDVRDQQRLLRRVRWGPEAF